MTIKIYTKSNCKYCNMLKKVLSDNTIGYSEINLENEDNLAKFRNDYPGVKKVPYGTFSNGDTIGSGDYHAVLEEVSKMIGKTE